MPVRAADSGLTLRWRRSLATDNPAVIGFARSPAARWLVVVIMLAMGVAAGAVIVTSPVGSVSLRLATAAATMAAAWSCLAVAVGTPGDLLPWRVRLLVLWLGCVWLVGTVAYLDVTPAMSAAAALVASLWLAALVHLVLALPDGRLPGPGSRALVAVAYVVAGPGALSLVLVPQSPSGDVALWLSAAARPVIGVVLVAVLLRRWLAGRTVTPAQAPLVVAAAAGVGLLTVVGLITPLVVGAAATSPTLGIDVATGLLLLVVPLGVVAVAARRQLRRSALVDLAARIEQAPPERLRDVLADALEDPGLTLAFRGLGGSGWVDDGGQPVAAPGGPGGSGSGAAAGGGGSGAAAAAVPVVGDAARPVAVLIPGPGASHDQAVLSGVRAVAGLALSNAALRADLAARLADVRASRERIVLARDLERRRLERDLHDGAQQHLLAALLVLGTVAAADSPASVAVAAGAAGAVDDERSADGALAAARAAEHVRSGLAEIRRLARGLHPAILDAEGLGPALTALLESWPHAVSAEVDLPAGPQGELPAAVAAAGYYVVTEALANAAKHAPETPVGVRVRGSGARLLVEVCDEGPGGAEAVAGGGLEGLGDRVAALGGRLVVDSPAGRGTRVRAELPCES